MAGQGDTGQGATLVLSSTGAVGRIRSMQLPEWVMEAIDASAIEDTGFVKKIPGDLSDAGELEIEAVFDAELDVPSNGTVETGTVTFPLSDPTNTVPATLAGSGFLTTSGLPNMATNELMILTLVFTYDGDTGPTFSTEAAT